MPKVSNEEVLRNSAASKKDRKKAERALKKEGKETPSKKKEVVYESVTINLLQGKEAMTEDLAKDLLGWEEVASGGKSLLEDEDGKKIRCVRNGGNRPFSASLANLYAQEILRGRWRLNGETIIVGSCSTILSGQHRLIGLVLACQRYRKDPEKYRQWWQSDPTIEVVVVTGVSEDDDVANTIDTGRSRSLSDVIYRSKHFVDMDDAHRKACARACDHAVRMLWDRTGVAEAYSVSRTHSEALDMLDRHGRLIACVKHVYEENVKNAIGKILPIGHAAGLLYLMSASNTDPKDYYGRDVRSEDAINFDKWDEAQTFWTEIAQNAARVKAVKAALIELGQTRGDAGVSLRERVALVIKAWLCGDKITADALKLKYKVTEDGVLNLLDPPCLGGIDRGETGDDEVILSDGDVADAAEDDRGSKSKDGGDRRMPKEGDEVWVKEAKGEPWYGVIQTIRKGPGGKEVATVRFQKNAKNYDVPYDNLSFEDPTAA